MSLASKLLAVPSAAAAGGAFTPPASNTIWYDATAITGLSDGDAVTTSDLLDQSGSSNDPTDVVAATYKTSIINGLPVVRLTGSTCMIQDSSYAPSTPCTVFWAMQFATVAGNATILDQRTGSGNLCGLDRVGTDLVPQSGGSSFTASGVASTSVVILALVLNGASSALYVNGGTPTTGTTASDTFTGGVRVFRNRYNFNSQAVDLGEFLFHDAALSASDMNSVGNYLERWGTTWSDI